jgi:hypothetical protein
VNESGIDMVLNQGLLERRRTTADRTRREVDVGKGKEHKISDKD